MTAAPPDPRLDPDCQEAAGARQALRSAYLVAERYAERLPARAAYHAAGLLGEVAAELVERAAGFRARMAARVARETPGGLTVRALAAELGVAPSKAGEFLVRAAREMGRPDDGPGRPAP